MSRTQFFSPAELLEQYPSVKRLGWTSTKIGVAYRIGLLNGFLCGKRNKAMISEASFRKLIRYHNEVNDARRIEIDND